MKLITLEKVRDSLRDMRHRRDRARPTSPNGARTAIERMVAIV